MCRHTCHTSMPLMNMAQLSGAPPKAAIVVSEMCRRDSALDYVTAQLVADRLELSSCYIFLSCPSANVQKHKENSDESKDISRGLRTGQMCTQWVLDFHTRTRLLTGCLHHQHKTCTINQLEERARAATQNNLECADPLLKPHNICIL